MAAKKKTTTKAKTKTVKGGAPKLSRSPKKKVAKKRTAKKASIAAD